MKEVTTLRLYSEERQEWFCEKMDYKVEHVKLPGRPKIMLKTVS